MTAQTAAEMVREARDHLLHTRENYQAACAGFRWPRPERFNFAFDWFDQIGRSGEREALRIIEADGSVVSRSYAQLSDASARAAGFLQMAGLRKGDAVLLLLDNCAALWEAMLAVMKAGGVIVPAATLLSQHDLQDRLTRANIQFVIATGEHASLLTPGEWRGVAVGDAIPGWLHWDDALAFDPLLAPAAPTLATDPLLLYFTSGTTAKPKLVQHSQISYPIGHLSTLYWIGLQPGDVHLNISSPGWAKHAWSCVFAPWLAEATVVAFGKGRFNARRTLQVLERERVSTFCAPPTVWRHLIQQNLGARPQMLREAVAAGEPLNPEVIDQVRKAWGITVRDGFGQTETSALLGNSPGQEITAGSVGRPLPGYDVVLLEREEDIPAQEEGELAVRMSGQRPVGVMQGYEAAGEVTPLRGPHYRTGDIFARSGDDRYVYVGRADDVFKASDYRISPFELESVLITHPAVVEAAVVPSPDPVKLAVPKAFVTLADGVEPCAALAQEILAHARTALGPFRRIRRLQFAELPKTVSGKIRRSELRQLEADQRQSPCRGPLEWWEEDSG